MLTPAKAGGNFTVIIPKWGFISFEKIVCQNCERSQLFLGMSGQIHQNPQAIGSIEKLL